MWWAIARRAECPGLHTRGVASRAWLEPGRQCCPRVHSPYEVSKGLLPPEPPAVSRRGPRFRRTSCQWMEMDFYDFEDSEDVGGGSTD